MDLYFAGAEAFSDIVVEEKVNILISYYYAKKKIDSLLQKEFKGKLFVDSGAFTAWTNHVTIDVDEYCDWINKYRDYLELFGQVDSIPGEIDSTPTKEQVNEAAKKTWDNYLYMRKKISRPEGLLYTFHVGEPFQYLKQALEWRDENGNPIPYIALGGMVRKTYIVKKNFLTRCFEIIKASSNPNVKVHAFGMTSFDLLEKFPITSADSTSWIMTGANGGIATDIGVIGVSENQSNMMEHYSHLPQECLEEFNSKLIKYGFDANTLGKDYKARLRYHLRYFRNKCENIPKMTINDFIPIRKLF